MELQVGVKAFLKNKDGKYLLLKRSRKKFPEVAGLWDIVGGRIETGTTLYENLQREIKEETSLELKNPIKIIDAVDILRVPGKHVVRLTYIGTIEGEPKVDHDEIEEYKWLTIDETKNHDDVDIFVVDLLNSIDIMNL